MIKKTLGFIVFALLFMSVSMSVPQQKEETLYKFNTSNSKYHKLDCKWAKKCTVNCIELTLKEIKDKKGIPCKVCKPPKE